MSSDSGDDEHDSSSISMTATLDSKGNLVLVPDGKPVIGFVPDMPNVLIATGHEGSGLTLALGTAEMVTDMIVGNPGKVDFSPFSIKNRF
ncbi:hypothetical protein PR202_ga16314 [Eleusine coracana subsp. coracana]|uniref:FAD dependent oxidoreductase domain-containing protein n=1 Tax=Eleusine coracana subsp. coracana TaxID=191504 RepID=A0AAV5CMV2_ELECO|nr:hypothetical protein PR202_ga16314 [Eleusine coracana subsp. coracana]